MPSALIGHTGFVGGNLARQHTFNACFNSKNIEQIQGRNFDLLAISAMPAAMWIANRDPAADRAVLDRITGCLRSVRADCVVVMSTVAVYPQSLGVDEETPIEEASQTPYGRHRLMLERFAAEHFPRVLNVRLPGLFGPGLKKNAIFDLLHNHETEKVHSGGVFQFYNLNRLWRDVATALHAGLTIVNFATEPVSVAEAAREAFGIEFANDPGTPAARFDMRSKHAALYGGTAGYLYGKAAVLRDMKAFVAAERMRGAA